jgi:glycosyltransferase involved in cell wall biosynthesis
MNFPRISIVMPSFNQGVFLEEAIRSILDQRYPNLEFMILDGQSTDKSREIIERYAASLAYWRSEPDQGQSDAIAQGLARATGDLLGWVNTDDALLPGSLRTIARAWQENPTGGLFGGNYILFDKDGRITRCKRHPANAGWFAKHGIFAFNPPGSFFKRQDYAAVGGLRPDLHYVMDNDLYLRMIARGTRYIYVNRYLSVFRQHEGQKPTVFRQQAQAEMARWQRELLPAELRRYALERRWLWLFRLWQVINGNYLRMYRDTARLKGRRWHTVAWE